MGTRHTITQIEAALRQADGQPSRAARVLGMSRQAIHERIRNSIYLQQVTHEIQEETLDNAESALVQAIRAGDGPMIRWYLDRKGKHRGYGTKTEPAVDQERIRQFVEGLGDDPAVLRAVRAALSSIR